MLRKGLVALIAVVALAAPAIAADLHVKIHKATCQNERFRFGLTNHTDAQIKYTVVLRHGLGQNKHYRARYAVPANGTATAWVQPDWNARDRYVVDVYRSWRPSPARHLARSSADLGGCAG